MLKAITHEICRGGKKHTHSCSSVTATSTHWSRFLCHWFILLVIRIALLDQIM